MKIASGPSDLSFIANAQCEPKYLSADEPTGALDSVNGQEVMDTLRDCSAKHGVTVIMVTHNPDFAKMANREIGMADGKILVS